MFNILLLLDSLIGDRICHASWTRDLINLTCSIKFRGNWAPIMEWKAHNSTKVISIGVNTTTVPNQLVTSTLVIPVLNGSRSYTCTTKFDLSGKPPTTTSINVPDYNVSWTHFGTFFNLCISSCRNYSPVSLFLKIPSKRRSKFCQNWA